MKKHLPAIIGTSCIWVAILFSLKDCRQVPSNSFSEENFKAAIAKEHKIAETSLARAKEFEFKAEKAEEKAKQSEENRSSLEPVWRETIKDVKQKCDSNAINTLDSLHKASVAACDTSVKHLNEEITFLKAAGVEKDTTIASKNRSIDLTTDAYSNQKEATKKERLGKRIWKGIAIGAAVVTTCITIAYLKNKKSME